MATHSSYSCLENLMGKGVWWVIESMGSQRAGHAQHNEINQCNTPDVLD